jgi:hypothetical protein
MNPKMVQFYTLNAMTLKRPKDIYKSILLNIKDKNQSNSSKYESLAL